MTDPSAGVTPEPQRHTVPLEGADAYAYDPGEPPGDRLSEIKQRYWRAAEADTVDAEAYGSDIAYLIAEVERLRAGALPQGETRPPEWQRLARIEEAKQAILDFIAQNFEKVADADEDEVRELLRNCYLDELVQAAALRHPGEGRPEPSEEAIKAYLAAYDADLHEAGPRGVNVREQFAFLRRWIGAAYAVDFGGPATEPPEEGK